jgi:glutamine synthetase
MPNIVYEYIFLDAKNNFRSKTKVIKGPIKLDKYQSPDIHYIPSWNYDGSSTGQAKGNNSEVILKPVYVCPDPFRQNIKYSYLVLCETYSDPNTPHPNNTRHLSNFLFKKYSQEKPWFGIEQEFFIINPTLKLPLGMLPNGKTPPQADYYCGIGYGNCFGRPFIEDVLSYCLHSKLYVTGLNFEVAPGQCEFQIRGEGVTACDELMIFRYILIRAAEKYSINIDFHPKPVKGDWNGSGCHVNFSTLDMRKEGGYTKIIESMNKLKEKHSEHIAIYGEDNDQRLTGHHETSSMSEFSYGIANRGCSVRIPRETVQNKCGYFEDRRPASNMDPYLVCSKILETVLHK